MLGDSTTLPQNNGTAAPTISPQQATQPAAPALNPAHIALAKAIRDNEGGNNYTAVGQSGEFGAYQITHGLYDGLAPKYGINVPLEQTTPEQQNQFVYKRIEDLASQGYNPGQIASIWNSGNPNPTGKVGVNKYGASYNTPQYVDNVYNDYMKYKGAATTQNGAQQPAPGAPTYGATFPYTPGDNPAVALAKAAGNLPSSVYGFGKGLLDMVFHPINTIENLGGVAIGGIEELTGNGGSQTPTFDAFTQALKDRYGGLDQLTNTATNDPFGLGADIAMLLSGGAGLAGKGAELGETASRAAQIVTRPIEGAAARIAAPFAGAVDAGVTDAAGRLGIGASELPASAISNSPVVRGAEALAGGAIGGGAIGDRLASSAERLTSLADNLVTAAGGSHDLEEAGRVLGQGLNDFTKEFRTTTSNLYDKFESIAKNPYARTSTSVDALNAILDRKAAIGDTGDASFFQRKLEVLQGGEPKTEIVPEGEAGSPLPKYPAPTFKTLKEMRTDVGQRLKSVVGDQFVTGNKQQLRQLYSALTDDMYSTMKSVRGKKAQDIVRSFDTAQAAFKDGAQKLQSSMVKQVMRFAQNKQWDRILPALLRPSASITDIKNIMAMSGEAGTAQIRSSLLQDIFTKATNADGKFTPGSIAKRLEKDGQKISQILTPEQFQALQDIGTVAKSLGKLTKITGGSQTAFLLDHLAQGGLVWWGAVDLITGNIVGAAQKLGAAIGSYGASRFIASEAGQKLLTTGLGNQVRAEAILGEIHRNGLTPPSASVTVGTDANTASLPEKAASKAAVGNEISAPKPPETGDSTTKLTSDFKAPTFGGRIKDSLQKYFENIQPGLSMKDVTEGGQQFNIGLTSVKGRIATATDDLAKEADDLYAKGDFAGAQAKYNDALKAGVKTLQDAYDGTGIKIKAKGVGFGVYGGLEPNYDAVAVVPHGKEDLFHYILSDVADSKFHQYSMLTTRQIADTMTPGVVDAARGISNEPFLRFTFDSPLTAENVTKVQEIAKKNELPGFSLKEGGKTLDVTNLSAYNKDYEQFSNQIQGLAKDLNDEGLRGAPQYGLAEARFVGSDPAEGHGLASYSSVRDQFHSQFPSYFDRNSGYTSRFIQRVQNKETVSRQEIDQLLNQPDIPAHERAAVTSAADAMLGEGKKIPVKNLTTEIEGRALPVSLYESDSYAQYGLDNVGLDYMPSKGEAPKTLVFKTPVDHGNSGHFNDTSHFGHTRVLVTEEDGKKVGYITEVQSDVYQKSDLAQSLVGYDKVTQARRNASDAFGYEQKMNDIRAEGDKMAEDGVPQNKIFDYLAPKKEALNAEREKVIAEAEKKATSDENLNPEQKQFLALGKNDRYQDVLLRGTLQYLKDKGVETVRIPTPSSAAKIEGFLGESAPYTAENGDPFPRNHELTEGDTIDYGGESYTVVNTEHGRVMAAPSDKVRSFGLDEYKTEESQYHWDEQAKPDFEPLLSKGGDLTPEAAQKAIENASHGAWDNPKKDVLNFDWHGTEDLLKEIAGGNMSWSLSDIEERMKEIDMTQMDPHSDLYDIYGDKAFIDGNTVHVVEDGANAEEFMQPSEYQGMNEDEAQRIDHNPKSIKDSFDNTQATVLNNYVTLHDKWLTKLAKEANVPIKYVDDSPGGSTWYEIPLPNIKRYLFGA